MNDTQKDMIYLLACAVNGITPEKAKVQTMDLEKLYQLAKFHSVRAAVCIALKSVEMQNQQFGQAYIKAVRKSLYLDAERSAILADFEKQGIWYVPLKGSVLKGLYPEYGMREMADNDILFDAEKRKQSKAIMLSLGYTAKEYGKSHHDVYLKPPILNFELHVSLFKPSYGKQLDEYYAKVKHLLRKDDDNGYGYHFSDEDFYVYMTAHEWRHYKYNGTGIRSLMDCYVYCKVKGEALHWDYIAEQCKILEMADFEQARRALAKKVFSSETLPDLTESEQEMLTYYLTAGAYGLRENGIKKRMKDKSKARFLRNSVFPNMDAMKKSVGFVRKFPILYPIGIIYRWGRAIVMRRKYISAVLKVMKKHDN